MENERNSQLQLSLTSLLFLRLSSLRMKLLLVAAAAAALLAVARCASVSLEDMEFQAWKLKFGESQPPAALRDLTR